MSFDTIVGYAYNGDIYCDECIKHGDALEGEDTGDSNTYPQPILKINAHADCGYGDEQHCSEVCADCKEELDPGCWTRT